MGNNRTLDCRSIRSNLKDHRNTPINIFGNHQERMTETRRRYELLFGLLLNSGLRISEALGLKVSDVRLVDGTAKSVRVIGKGDKERLVPLPEAFGAVFGFWLKDRARGDYVFARALGQKPVSAQAARAYLRLMLNKAGIEKKISPHKLRHTYATNLLNAGDRTGGHQGPARPREHQYHPDLHQRRAGADGAGGGEVVSGGSGLQGKRQDLTPS